MNNMSNLNILVQFRPFSIKFVLTTFFSHVNVNATIWKKGFIPGNSVGVLAAKFFGLVCEILYEMQGLVNSMQ